MDFRVKQSILPKIGTLAVGLALITLVGGCRSQTANLDASLGQAPRADVRLVDEDFGFPSQPPSLARGREVFQANCASCHAASYWQTQQVKEDIAYTTPIDTFLLLSTGQAPEAVMPNRERQQRLPATHPVMKTQIPNRDDRWAVIFYTRYLAGAGNIENPNPARTDLTMASVFGGNCAVCHGSFGRADGPLHIGKTGNHELHDAKVFHNLLPAPADFRQYDRMYNRTDAQIFKYICQGIYPSAMPSWYGNVDRDPNTGEINFVFDDRVIWNLVRYVRTLAYNNDLDPDLPEMRNPPPGLAQLQPCPPVPQNRPWTAVMRQQAPNAAAAAYQAPAGDPVTGGMTFQSRDPHRPDIHQEGVEQRPSTHGRFGI